MKLLLDIGNTRIKWAYLTEAGLQQPGEFIHRGVAVAAIEEVLHRLPVSPRCAAAVNVAGQALGAVVAKALKNAHNIDLQFVRTSAQWGELRNGYSDCSQLGADRWAAMVSAWQQYRTNLCVVDAGTAVTIDLLRADGQHLGGLILAGRQLAQSALLGETADIAEFATRKNDPDELTWYGRSTREAVSCGADFSLSSAIVRAAQNFPGLDRPAGEPLILLTGGDAEHLLPLLHCAAEYRPALVLDGVAYLAGWR